MKLYFNAPWESESIAAGETASLRHIGIAVLMLTLSCALTVFLVFDSDDLTRDCIQAVATRGLVYDSGATNRPAQPSPEIFETRNASFKSFDLKMRVMLDSFGSYTNLFQTSTLNHGIRMETASNGTLALIIGRPDASDFHALIVSSVFTPLVWHTIEVHISASKHIQAIFDGTVGADVSIPSIDYELRDIVLGNGFSKTRPLAGRIDDAAIRYGLYETVPVRKEALQGGTIGSALLSFSLLCFAGTARRRGFRGNV